MSLCSHPHCAYQCQYARASNISSARRRVSELPRVKPRVHRVRVPLHRMQVSGERLGQRGELSGPRRLGKPPYRHLRSECSNPNLFSVVDWELAKGLGGGGDQGVHTLGSPANRSGVHRPEELPRGRRRHRPNHLPQTAVPCSAVPAIGIHHWRECPNHRRSNPVVAALNRYPRDRHGFARVRGALGLHCVIVGDEDDGVGVEVQGSVAEHAVVALHRVLTVGERRDRQCHEVVCGKLVTNLFKQSSPQPRSRPPGERVHHHERQRSHLFGHPPQCIERPLMQRPAVSPAAIARAPAVAGSGRGLPVGRLLRVVNPPAAPTVIPKSVVATCTSASTGNHVDLDAECLWIGGPQHRPHRFELSVHHHSVVPRPVCPFPLSFPPAAAHTCAACLAVFSRRSMPSIVASTAAGRRVGGRRWCVELGGPIEQRPAELRSALSHQHKADIPHFSRVLSEFLFADCVALEGLRLLKMERSGWSAVGVGSRLNLVPQSRQDGSRAWLAQLSLTFTSIVRDASGCTQLPLPK
eukprot:m.88690 g.88690  ORF g.88690 m.88690 type:complete len:524 (+) comp11665_c0_seq1:107-1678(+)